jgi:uncharacterized RDD family membrane protein YckC
MSVDAASAIDSPASPAYGRFSRRLKAFFIDWVVTVLVLFGALFIAVQLESAHIARVLGFTVVIFLLLYEPLLVSLAGGTIGHYMTNLRVVDNRSHGNVNFGKALVRLVIKNVLGLYSFITMAITRRHQTVHDLVTQSTVQLRDISKSDPHDYVEERPEIANQAMPSLARRLVVIAVYQILLFLIFRVAVMGLEAVGAISEICLARDVCSSGDDTTITEAVLAWLVLAAVCVVQGWRGRLPGCRVGIPA